MEISSKELLTLILDMLKSSIPLVVCEKEDTNIAEFKGHPVSQIFDDFEALNIIITKNVDMGMIRVSVDVDDYNHWATSDLLATYITEKEYKLLKGKIKEYERRRI